VTIDCHQFESHLNQLLDQRAALRLDAPFEEHARQCPACAELLDAHRDWLYAITLGGIRPSQPADLLAQRVWDAHRRAAASRAAEPSAAPEDGLVAAFPQRAQNAAVPRRVRGLRAIARWTQARPWTVSVGSALAVLVLVAVLALWPEAPHRGAPVAEQPVPSASAPTREPIAARPPLSHLAQQAGSRWAELLRDTRLGAADAAVLIPALESPAVDWLLPEDPPAWRGVAGGWRTLANSTGRVVDLLAAVLPEDEDDAKENADTTPDNGALPTDPPDEPL
jgi:hypothetical protein